MPAKKSHRINLLPKEDFEKTTLGRIMKWALTSFRFIVIVVELIVIGGFLFRFYLDVKISNLDDEIQQKSALISSRSSFEQEFRKLQEKLGIYKQITIPENMTLPSVEDIANSLPVDTKLISLMREHDLVKVTGSSQNEASIGTFIAALKEKERFQDVSLTQVKTLEDNPDIEFSLNITLNREGQ